MKYIFIANANAGKKDALTRIDNEIKSLSQKIDSEIYQTQGKKDATRFVK